MYLMSSPRSSPPVMPSPGIQRLARQRGIVLLVALIVLLVLTFAGVSLVRSVSTTNMIAGNQAFRESAVFSGESGSTAALTWLMPLATTNTLHSESTANAYFAQFADPASGQSWHDFWTNSLSGRARSLAADASGNTVSYVIHRLCDKAGDPASVSCKRSANLAGISQAGGAGATPIVFNNLIYYRITVRIDGPRNTVAYIQTFVAL